MNIKITSDSTCDLSKELLDRFSITIQPLSVMIGGKQYLDGVNAKTEDIYNHVAAGGDLCTTAAVNVGEYEELFSKYASEYDGVIHINLGSGFSSCYQNACIAAEDHLNVRVIDSRNLSTGQGLIVLRACELASSGKDLDEIAAELNELTGRVETSFLIDRLDYMVKGGRCSAVAALGANLLKLKPCIEVRDGKMSVVKKYRGNYAKCLAQYIKDRLCNRDDLEYGTLFATRTAIDDTCLEAVREAISQSPAFENTYWTEAGCTIGCHCGPGSFGVLFIRKK